MSVLCKKGYLVEPIQSKQTAKRRNAELALLLTNCKEE